MSPIQFLFGCILSSIRLRSFDQSWLMIWMLKRVLLLICLWLLHVQVRAVWVSFQAFTYVSSKRCNILGKPSIVVKNKKRAKKQNMTRKCVYLSLFFTERFISIPFIRMLTQFSMPCLRSPGNEEIKLFFQCSK